MMKKAVSFLMILIMLFTACTALADDSFNVNKDGYSTSYTYGYDYWRDVQESPAMTCMLPTRSTTGFSSLNTGTARQS